MTPCPLPPWGGRVWLSTHMLHSFLAGPSSWQLWTFFWPRNKMCCIVRPHSNKIVSRRYFDFLIGVELSKILPLTMDNLMRRIRINSKIGGGVAFQNLKILAFQKTKFGSDSTREFMWTQKPLWLCSQKKGMRSEK